MKRPALIAAAGLLAYAAYRMSQDSTDATTADAGGFDWAGNDSIGGDLVTTAEGVLTDATQTAAGFIDEWTGGMMQVSAMARVPTNVLANANVQAMLKVIRAGEGTADINGYRRIFGGQTFNDFADHPRIKVSASGYTSTAAGAYQMLTSTWDETKRIMKLPDFSPASQDLAAVGRMAARGALDDIIAGRIDTALKKISREWASLPYSPYGQPTISIERARGLFASAGGAFSDNALA